MNFRPSLTLTLLLLTLALLFACLGFWQLQRMELKQELFDEFKNAVVHVSGRYDTSRHVLLDNKIHQGRAGVHVLTPFILDDGAAVLVNRGWLPMPADRLTLPAIPTDGATRDLHGQLRTPSKDGVRIGDPDILVSGQWPQLVTYLEMDAVGMALGLTLSPSLVLLDASDPTGFEGRQWKAAEMTPAVHGAYATQWFGLAVAAVIIWIVLGVKRAASMRHLNTRKVKP